MASKEYVAIFVPRAVRDDIKAVAQHNGRTMIGELRVVFDGKRKIL